MNDPDPTAAEPEPELQSTAANMPDSVAAAARPSLHLARNARPRAPPTRAICARLRVHLLRRDRGCRHPRKSPTGLVGGRFKLTTIIGERGGVVRFRGEDVGTPDEPIPVIVVRQAGADMPPTESAESPKEPRESSEFDFDLRRATRTSDRGIVRIALVRCQVAQRRLGAGCAPAGSASVAAAADRRVQPRTDSTT